MKPMTRADLMTMAQTQVDCDLVTAGRAWNLGRSSVYELARAGALPFNVCLPGNVYKVPVEGLLVSLGIELPGTSAPLAPAQARRRAPLVNAAVAKLRVRHNNTATSKPLSGAA